ncbi:unnamed protein product [Soboliphyme baturini]|uniref:PAS-4 n=1 Tax=Soboliphyme baturini TaxID=241478 RepID=A0A183J007_9BILA|nr:unnamed protein product [Soboliphyme baturini]
MLRMSFPCPRISDIFQNTVMRSDPVMKIMSENKDFFDMLRNQTGLKLETLDSIYDVFDPLESEHDTTIIALLSNLGVYDAQLIPQFAACVIIEVHENDGAYSVNLLYKIDASSSLVPLIIPDCAPNCSMTKFIEITQRFGSQSWKEACGISEPMASQDLVKTLKIIASVMGGLAVLFLLLFMLSQRRLYEKLKA